MSNEDYRNPAWRSSPGLIPAIIIIGIGVLFLLNNLHVVYVQDWWRYWPVMLIAGGLAKLMDATAQGPRIIGAMLIGAGALFLADNLGLIQLSWDAFWPLVLIGIGLLMLWNRLSLPQLRLHRAPADAPEGYYCVNAIFSGFKRKMVGVDFTGAAMTAIFGGGELNLRQAGMAGDTAVIEATAIFGGIEIKVPENWLVIGHGTGVFGGFSDQTHQISPNTPGLKRLIIKGEAIFGGVNIRN
jgi:hypothetical protein